MPFVNLYAKAGLTEGQIERAVQEVTAAIADNLENTLPRMVRISFYEIPTGYFHAEPSTPDSCTPTLVLQLGPGRSDEAVAKCVDAVAEAVSHSLDCPKADVRFYVERVPGENFAIGGKIKDFNKKVK